MSFEKNHAAVHGRGFDAGGLKVRRKLLVSLLDFRRVLRDIICIVSLKAVQKERNKRVKSTLVHSTNYMMTISVFFVV